MKTSKDAFLAALEQPSISTKDVETPGFGNGTIRIRELTGSVRNRLEAAYAVMQNGGDTKSLDEAYVHLIANCVLDDNDSTFLTLGQAKKFLATHPSLAFKVRDEVIGISGMAEEDAEAMAEVFDDAQSDSSTSD